MERTDHSWQRTGEREDIDIKHVFEEEEEEETSNGGLVARERRGKIVAGGGFLINKTNGGSLEKLKEKVEEKEWRMEGLMVNRERVFDSEKEGRREELMINYERVFDSEKGTYLQNGTENGLTNGVESPEITIVGVINRTEIIPSNSNSNPDSNSTVNLKDYDLEKVLEEQDTHDLYCPNCNSCITKRVILKKRKRTVREINSESPPDKIPNLGENLDSLDEPLLDRDDDERDQHIFVKCLSCFTFFIPEGFFVIRGGNKERIPTQTETNVEPKEEGENIIHANPHGRATNSKINAHQSSQNSSDTWFFDIFGINHKNRNNKPGKHDESEIEDIESRGTKSQTDIKPPSSFTFTIQPSEMKSPEGNGTQINFDPDFMLPSRGEQIVEIPPAVPRGGEQIIDISAIPRFRPRNCRLCPGVNNWDMLKPIVYGGLVETIMSLSIISSASATGATTLNIFLLGIANLIGGFTLLLHGLMEVKRAQDEANDSNDDEMGRYFALLGRKGHFGLHATIAIISYLVFGLLPPIIYGFTFRETDNSEYKMIATALSAIICIVILAIGKAHVRPERTYFKTLFYYVAIGVQASGLSYVAGILVKKLVEKLGLFGDGSSVGYF